MQFLMGLNESFVSIRAQVLLMDPLHSLSKVFSLILQEERQREITSPTPLLPEASPPPLVAAANGPPFRRQRPFCSHCNILGHTKEKCYKLHGFPPGYRPKQTRPTPHPQSNAIISHNPDPLLPTSSLTPQQYTQLLSLLSPNPLSSPPSSPTDIINPTVASINGSGLQQDDWDC